MKSTYFRQSVYKVITVSYKNVSRGTEKDIVTLYQVEAYVSIEIRPNF